MDLEALANLSWREALIAIIVLLALYVFVAFLRMWRLKRAKEVVGADLSLAGQAAIAAYSAEQKPHPSPKTFIEPAVPEFPWNEPPPEIPGQQLINALERDVFQLRSEVNALRSELLQVREEIRRDESPMQAAPNISPLYSDAMQMAIQGHDATTISQHCGIARAEAELVVALVRNRNDGN